MLCLFGSLGYLERSGDVAVLSEFHRVLAPGTRLVMRARRGNASALEAFAQDIERMPTKLTDPWV